MSGPEFPGGGSLSLPLPFVSPDHAEETLGEEIDNMIPTAGYNRQPVVGLGGSAGALGALKIFLESMPPDTGMAFVVVTHLSPDHESLMAEILQRITPMPVVQVSGLVQLQPDCVYVIPPSRHLIMMDGHLELAEMDREMGKRVAVDLFFRTLADTHGPHAVGVILSGADGDGAIGIKRIKERGGLTIVQEPGEAEQDGMPRAAIATGMADWVLPVREMPGRILEYVRQEKRLHLPPEEGPAKTVAAAGEDLDSTASAREDEREGALRGILTFLRTRTGRDFTCYKRATILRRIGRRMQVNSVAEMAEYLSFLRTHPGEAGALLQDLLISVTNFFRDREAFTALEAEIPSLFAAKRGGDQVRVWTAGCATGEEAYSVAILLTEYADTLDSPPSIQVFATDLDENALHQARAGVYTESIAADVSEERLRRFFTRENGRLRVRTEVRERVLFAVHDLFRDAPFSRLDLITCRNLFIYVNREMQQNALEVFHFSLRPEGRLFLGSAESADAAAGLFTAFSKKHRIYARSPSPQRGLPLPEGFKPYPPVQIPSAAAPVLSALTLKEHAVTGDGERESAGGSLTTLRTGFSGADLHLRLLKKIFPPSVVIDADGSIVHLSGAAGQWLAFSEGEPTHNLLRLVHPGLRGDLRTALLHAAQNPAVTVEVRDVPVEFEEGKSGRARLRVCTAGAQAPGYFLVVFSEDEERGEVPSMEIPAIHAGGDDWITRHLEEELEQTRRRLRDTEEQHRASIEEMKAGNEELQAMNEELRSAGEELVTSREELQSVNEELQTVNQELKSRVEELSHTNSDLQNLMAATDIATVFLDRELRIKRYTPSAVALFNFIPSDLGRPLFDLTHRLDYPRIDADARQVLESLAPAEREVRAGERWYLARLQPYRTVEDRIAGVVLTFVDITVRRAAEEGLRESEQRLRSLVEAHAQAVWETDPAGTVVSDSPSWRAYTGQSLREWTGSGWLDAIHPEEQSQMTRQWREAVEAQRNVDAEFRLRHAETGGWRWTSMRATPILSPDGAVLKWSGMNIDIHARKQAEEALRSSEAKYRTLFDFIDEGFCLIEILFNEKNAACDYRFIEVNPAFEKHTGLKVGQAVGRTMRELVPGHEAHWYETYGRVVLTGQPERFEQFAETMKRHFDVYAFRTGRPEEHRVAILFTDITARKQAEEAVAADLHAMQTLRELGTRVIPQTDTQGLYDAVTAAAIKLAGAEAGSVQIFDPETCELVLLATHGFPADSAVRFRRVSAASATSCGKALATGQRTVIDFDSGQEDPKGDLRWHVEAGYLSAQSTPLLARSGQPIGMLSTHWRAPQRRLSDRESRHFDLLARQAADLIEQRLAFSEIQTARAEAETAGRAKDNFLAVLSHELRTPLTPVIMILEDVLGESGLPEPLRGSLEMTLRNVELEVRLIDDMLDMTRIARGKFELSQRLLDVHEILRKALEICQPDLVASHHRTQLELTAAQRWLQGDGMRLQQVFWNLIKNACKFTPPGGSIRMTSRNPDSGSLEILIADNGPGIPPEALEHIFEPFAQAGIQVTRQFGGLGLGLAISKAITEAHGGTLTVSSEGIGKGAVFTITLPISPRPDENVESYHGRDMV